MRIYTRMQPAKAVLALIAVLALTAPTLAQQAGFRDLTASWRAPDDHVPSPSPEKCPNYRSTVSGSDVAAPQPAANDSLEFTITDVSPAQLTLGEDFTATVRVKNNGATKVLIPWQPDGEQVAKVSQDGTEEKYEVADVTFHLTNAGKNRIAIPLDTDGALFAHPDNPATYLQIDPGRWADIKLKATVQCGLENCRSSVRPDDHAALSAWWYQRVLTHQVKDCIEDHGVQKIREVESVPLTVVVRAAETPSKDKPKRPAPDPNIASGRLLAGFQYSPRE